MEKLNKYFIKSFLFITLLAFTFASCSDDDDNNGSEQKLNLDKTGAFVLGEGKKGDNNAKLSHYSLSKYSFTGNVFEKQNKGLKLGNTAQDILIYGGKAFITVTNSDMLFVTDLDGVLLEEISFAKTAYNQPRFMVEDNGYVYIDFYSGHLVRLNTSTLKIDDSKDVLDLPANPEQMAKANGKLYITNSRKDKAEGKTLTVVNLSTFKKEADIAVHVNPTRITSDSKGNVYVLSWGDYTATDNGKSALSVIKAGSDKAEVAKLGDAGTFMVMHDDKLIIAQTVYDKDNDYYPITSYSQYDISKVKTDLNEGWSDKSFFDVPADKDAAQLLTEGYFMSVNPANSDVYVSVSNYRVTGAVLIFDKEGKFKEHIPTGMVNTQKVAFMQGK